MRKILLDTNGYTHLTEGNRTILSEIARAHTVHISSIVIGELYAGFKGGTKEQKNKEVFYQFLQGSTIKIVPVATETAEIYADIKHRLKKSGTPIPTNDIWIAAQALETGSVLITYDTHFSKIPGLRLWDGFTKN